MNGGNVNEDNVREIVLSQGWQILQDVHDVGEQLGIFDDDFASSAANCVSFWEPLEVLGHLQVVRSSSPYWGRRLRAFNIGAWWYRVEVDAPADFLDGTGTCTVELEGVDYEAKVWLNGALLGNHEGYWQRFGFELGDNLRTGRNVLVVKVRAPFDEAFLGGAERRTFGVVRNQIKGTYEHADGLIQRDVNPIGIWGEVRLVRHAPVREMSLKVAAEQGREGSTAVTVEWRVAAVVSVTDCHLEVSVADYGSGYVLESHRQAVGELNGAAALSSRLVVEGLRPWEPWDRGGPTLYSVNCRILDGDGREVLSGARALGVRSVALERTEGGDAFLLNGERYFVRGTSYFPDAYVSLMDRGRYQRDIQAAIRAGFNALRVHVHVERPEFYEECDRLGVLVFQDSDINWTFPHDEAFTARAHRAVSEMVERLGGHPCVALWICMNEGANLVDEARPGADALSGSLYGMVRALDPRRPAIANSGDSRSEISGDEHVYFGSLEGGEYTDVAGERWRFITEFGVDAPPGNVSRVGLDAGARRRLARLLPRVAELHDYQYNLIKYYIQHARLQRFAPCAGYFQFMLIDISPQSFYGVYDYWGNPKVEGLGGSLRALAEVNQPVAVLASEQTGGWAIHVANDLATPLGECVLEFQAVGEAGAVSSGEVRAVVGSDALVCVATLTSVEVGALLSLTLRGADGRVLAQNRYEKIGVAQRRPVGCPGTVDHEYGMRTWLEWGGDGVSRW
jgi:beta-mannosidase